LILSEAFLMVFSKTLSRKGVGSCYWQLRLLHSTPLTRLTNLVDAAGTTKFAYDAAGNLASEDGPWSSDTVSYTYHSSVPHLRTALSLQQPSGSFTHSYSYDAARRLQMLGGTAGAFTYTSSSGVGAATSASALLKKLALPNSSYVTNTFDSVARLLSTKLNNSSHTTLNAHSYLYNAGHERTRHTRTDGSYVAFTYDNVSQLKTAVGNGGQSTENLGYLYDTAWNLNSRTNAGTPTTFSVNVKNELTAVGGVSYSYDNNGNLTSTSDYRSYTYDDENQLTKAEQYQNWKTEFSYDGRQRLRVRKDYTWNAGYGQWQLSGETRYLYDGMRVIQERNSSNTPTVAYTRGPDLSGSLEGAGGIGGLLARSHGYSGGSWSTHSFYHADGGGNVTYLVNSSQARVAEYRYDPYGRALYTYDSLPGGGNRYRFSSKELVTGGNLYYYGYRFYDPNLQRWPNRDPFDEEGGLNLYAFVGNDPIDYYDRFGLKRSCDEICKDALTDPNVSIQGMGGVVCDSDGTKCPCAFQFIVPGTTGDIYHPGECPALDDIIKKHEKQHIPQTECKPKNPGEMCRAVYTPKYEPKDKDIHCKLWKQDIKNMDKALKKASGRCADVIRAVLNDIQQKYNQQCGKK
jgi:RHS repeat-associated protein